MKLRQAWKKFWCDKEGKVVLFQSPNAPLLAFILFDVLAHIFSGVMGQILSIISRAALAYWAALELTQGVTYFRRALGLVVLIFTFVGILKL